MTLREHERRERQRKTSHRSQRILSFKQWCVLNSISEATGATPTGGGPPAPPRAMPTAVPLEPGQQTVSFSVTAVWELE